MMSHYRVSFRGDGLGEAKEVEFEAEDGSRALQLLSKELPGREATLFRDSRFVCILKRLGHDKNFVELQYRPSEVPDRRP